MVDPVGEPSPGLRERKKLRTRATLIDAAVELCLEQGYENTTVEQIAAVADVSPRTFSRYFTTKDAVMMTLMEGFVEAASERLALIPEEVPALEALKCAHVDVLKEVRQGSIDGLTVEQIVLMLKIINSTPGLKAAAAEFRPDPAVRILARRLGVEFGDRKLHLVQAVWASIIVTACGDLVSGFELGPELMVDRIETAFSQFAEMTADLTR